jgi:hypothetical protein
MCHTAGGGDNLLLVQGNYLVTLGLDRAKQLVNRNQRRETPFPVKRLARVKGTVSFVVSPDSSKALVLQEDLQSGHYQLDLLDDEELLNPMNTEITSPLVTDAKADDQRPSNELVQRFNLSNPLLAFWFSPDSNKILFLAATKPTLSRIAMNDEMFYIVYDTDTKELRSFRDKPFIPSPYFMKAIVPFFTQHTQVSLFRQC